MEKKSNAEMPSVGRLGEIAELAEFIAEDYWGGGAINPLAIAKAKGITFTFNDYGDAYDGLLEHKGGAFHIFINLRRVESRDSDRSRFTLCHELGHFFIDEHRLALAGGLVPAHKSVCEFESRNPVEREADHFACNLLLPAARFRAAARKASRGLDGVLRLRRLFGASVTSTAIRFATLGIHPCAVVKWDGSKVKWRWFSGDTREAGFRKTIENRSVLAPGSPTERALSGESCAEGFHRGCTTAAAWFPWISERDSRNVLMIEEAVVLGRYGVLTFLYPESGRLDFNNPL